MISDTLMLSQKHTGSSFKASIITNRLSCMCVIYILLIHFGKFKLFSIFQFSVICKHLSTYRQEDAHEFLRYLIESMERCYLSVLGHAAKSYVLHFIHTF